MKRKLIITSLVAIAFGAVWLCFHWWLRDVFPFLKTHETEIDISLKILGTLGTVATYLIATWSGQPEGISQTAVGSVSQTAHAGGDVVQAGRDAQAAGVNFSPQGSASVAGDVAGGNITKITVEQDRRDLPALHGLRPPVADFIGREREIDMLVSALRGGGRAAVAGIRGMGGIGKTELALVVADRVRNDYPDAHLLLNLQGTDTVPLAPVEALASCIRALEGTAANLPEALDELKGIYLNRLDGKRALIFLDNAADGAQVRPLIPPSGCGLLVTSREAIALPRMKSLQLEELPLDQAKELLATVAQRAITDKVADEICRLCGCLPLALRATGSLLNETADLDPADYATQLRDERTRLERIGQAGVDLGVEATLNLSYKRLPKDTARVFRSLAVFPGSFDARAEESVCRDPAHSYLSALARRSLVLYDEPTQRYRLHDLVRAFAGARPDGAEHMPAQLRHAGHYKDVLATADDLYLKGGESVKKGLALYEAEWGNIRAGQVWAAAHANDNKAAAQLCSQYPDAGVYCLGLRLHPRDWIGWLEAGLAAAGHLKDHSAEGRALGNLGIAYKNLGEYKRAIEFHEQRLKIAREIGDRRGEGNALGNLGNAYDSLGEYKRAIEFHEQSLVIDREIGDRRGEEKGLGGLGNAYYSLGEYKRAIEYHEQALAIDRETGDRRGEGQDLGNLGNAYYSLGEYHRAIEFYEQRLKIAREIGDRRGEGNGLWNMSATFDKLGDRAKAIANAEAALMILEQIESPHVEKVRKQLAEWRGKA